MERTLSSDSDRRGHVRLGFRRDEEELLRDASIGKVHLVDLGREVRTNDRLKLTVGPESGAARWWKSVINRCHGATFASDWGAAFQP